MAGYILYLNDVNLTKEKLAFKRKPHISVQSQEKQMLECFRVLCVRQKENEIDLP